jgi:hypothetical protein
MQCGTQKGQALITSESLGLSPSCSHRALVRLHSHEPIQCILLHVYSAGQRPSLFS